MYNIVRQHNSQEIKERLLYLEESLYNAPPRRNTVQEDMSKRSQAAIPEPTTTRRDEAPKSQNLQKSKKLFLQSLSLMFAYIVNLQNIQHYHLTVMIYFIKSFWFNSFRYFGHFYIAKQLMIFVSLSYLLMIFIILYSVQFSFIFLFHGKISFN